VNRGGIREREGAVDDRFHRSALEERPDLAATRCDQCLFLDAVTGLATEVFLGDPSRFVNGKAVASYVGMIPSEYSSGGRQRLGALTKQGNPFLRFLWCEAAIHAVRRDTALGRFYRRKLQQKGLEKARVAVGRKLGIRLWILLRDQINYEEFCRRAASKPTER
jgi:hypothetical protein